MILPPFTRVSREEPLERETPTPIFVRSVSSIEKRSLTLISSRLVQTNEVRRSACLLPAFGSVIGRTGDIPLSLVEIGASAGLNLLLDRYRYDYGDGSQYGDPESRVHLSCSLRGVRDIPIPDPFPRVAVRVGLDLDPIDVKDPAATSWLRALVWPEHSDRAENLRLAIELARRDPPRLMSGDALRLLPEVLAGVPRDSVLCLFHTFIYQQFAPPARLQLTSIVEAHAQERDIFLISIEWRARHPTIEVVAYMKGSGTHTLLGYCDSHATWLEWL